MSAATSFPRINSLPKHRVSALLAAGWARVASSVGKGRLVDAVEATEKTVENAMAGRTVPELHTALNSLAADPTALDELLAGYGVKLCPLHAEAANDIATAAGLSEVVSALLLAIADGHRDHIETIQVATHIRPYLPALLSIVAEADRLLGSGSRIKDRSAA